jgi:hypothetical protein
MLKMPSYIIFNPEDGQLEVYHLKGGHYQRQTADAKGRYWIESMKLFLGVWEGLKEDVGRQTFWLRWWDAKGNQLPWKDEKKRLEIETRKALASVGWVER